MDYEYTKRIPICPTSMNRIIKNGGYYDINNNWNSIIKLNKYPDMVFRGRVEVFIFKDDMIYMHILNSNKYRIPGGSFNIENTNIDQVYKEAKEETKILVKDIQYTGINYIKIFDNRNRSGGRAIKWDGTYNEVYIAKYDKLYNGHIKNSVYDYDMHNLGRFYKLKNVINNLSDDHKKALSKVGIIDYKDSVLK